MTAVLNWIKRNWLIVTMIAVMIICLPVVFVVVEMLNTGTKEAIEKRVNDQLNQIKQVESAEVVVTPLTPTSKQINENMTLNEALVSEYEAVRQTIKSDAEAVVQAALAVNQKHDQLVEGLLPSPPPGGVDLPFQIHPAYVAAHERLLEDLGAGAPPAPEEVSNQLVEFDRNYRRTQLNVEPGVSLRDSELEKLREAMTEQRLAIYRQRASDISVYADLSVFKLDSWSSSDDGSPTPRQMYDWQHQTWLHSDILKAIGRANGEGDGAVGNVVKRITFIERGDLTGPTAQARSRISGRQRGGEYEGYETAGGEFSGRPIEHAGRGMEGGGRFGGSYETFGGDQGMFAPPGASGGAEGTVANADPAVPFTYNYAVSVTGRASSGLYDVRIVRLGLIVDSSRIQDVLNAIGQTNFMTVTGINVETVNVFEHLASGYFYGMDPVAHLTLDIETLWFRPWTTKLMPDPVKKLLGVPVEAAAAATPEDK